MMKRLLSLTIIPVFILLLSSCNFDLYDGKRPFNYGAAKWVCEEPDAWFVVDPDADDYYSPEGEMEIDEEVQRIKLIFVNGTNRVFIDLLDSKDSSSIAGFENLIDGKCSFSSEKMIIEVYKDMDATLNEKYDELVFVRMPIE